MQKEILPHRNCERPVTMKSHIGAVLQFYADESAPTQYQRRHHKDFLSSYAYQDTPVHFRYALIIRSPFASSHP